MVFEGRGFESTSWFLGGVGLSLQPCFSGVVGLSPHVCFLGVRGFFIFLLFGWWFYFDFLGDYFLKGLFYFFYFVLEVYLYLFNIHTFIYVILFVLWGGVSVGRCAFLCFWT